MYPFETFSRVYAPWWIRHSEAVHGRAPLTLSVAKVFSQLPGELLLDLSQFLVQA